MNDLPGWLVYYGACGALLFAGTAGFGLGLLILAWSIDGLYRWTGYGYVMAAFLAAKIGRAGFRVQESVYRDRWDTVEPKPNPPRWVRHVCRVLKLTPGPLPPGTETQPRRSGDPS